MRNNTHNYIHIPTFPNNPKPTETDIKAYIKLFATKKRFNIVCCTRSIPMHKILNNIDNNPIYNEYYNMFNETFQSHIKGGSNQNLQISKHLSINSKSYIINKNNYDILTKLDNN